MAQVTLQAVVNFEQVNQLQQKIDKLNGQKITIGVQDFSKQLQDADKSLSSVNDNLTKTVRVFNADGELTKGVDEFERGVATTVRVTRKLNEETGELEKTQTRVSRNLKKEQREAAKAQEAHTEEVKKGNEEVKNQGLLYNILGRSVSSFLARMAAYRAVYAGIRAITNGFKESLETLKAVDDELVTVRKVTGFDAAQMARVESQSYAVASKYGASAADYTSSVAAFARAGYKDLSGDLAELAEKTKIVGDTTAEIANQFLLSMDAAYKYQGSVEKLNRILDISNEIDNKWATSIEKLAEGMGIVAPVAAQLHVTEDELVAMLGTITAVTQRSGSEAARALRSILINLTSDVNAVFEETNGEITYAIGEIDGLRDIVMEYAGDLYKVAEAQGKIVNPAEVIEAMVKAAEEGRLTEQKLYSIVTDESGKLRAAQMWALIQNWNTMYKSMLNDAANAAGSAEKEIENAMDSWTRKSEVLKNTWTQFVKTGLNSEAVKGFLDILTSIVQRLGTLPGVLTRIAVIVVGMKLPQITKSVTTFFADIKKNGIGSINGLSAAIAGLGVAWSVVSYIVEDAKRKHEEIIESQYKAADAATANAERILALAVDMESAESGTDSLRKAQESLASAFETDLPDSIDVSIKKLRELTEEQIRTAAAAANTALITAGDEFTRASEGNGPTQYIAIMRERNANTGLEKNPYYDEDYLPGGLNEIVASRLSELNLRQKQEGDMFAIYDARSLEGALKFHESMELINSDIDEYVRLSGDRSVLDTEYYKTLQRYLSDTAGAFSIYEEKQKAAFDNEVMLEFLAAIQSTSVKSKEDVDALIESFRDTEKYTSDETDALIELTEKYFHFEDAVETSEAAVEKETDAIFANQKALEANATAADRAAAAKKDAEAAVRRLIPALWDESGALSATGVFALEADKNLAGMVKSELEAQLAAKQANYSSLVAQLATVGVTAAYSAQELRKLSRTIAGEEIIAAGGGSNVNSILAAKRAEIKQLMSQIRSISTYSGGSSGGGSGSGHSGSGHSGGGYGSGHSGSGHSSGGSSSSSKEDKKLTALKDRVSLLKSELSLMKERGDSEEDQIAKMRQIQKALRKEYEYLKSIKGDQITINNLYQEWYSYANQISDLEGKAADEAQKHADAIQAAVEAQKALDNILKNRSVRVYNAATGQWEWQADPAAVASAQSDLNNAISSAGYTQDAWALLYSMLSGVASIKDNWLNSGPGAVSNAFGGNSYGNTYNFGSIRLSEAQAQSMTVAEFARLANALPAFNNSP